MKGVRSLIVGASSGIGRSVAEQLLQRGAEVCVAARSTDALAALCDSVGDRGHVIGADLAAAGDCRRMVEQAAERMDGIDLVVHAAGVGTLTPMADTDPSSWRQTFDVNVLAPTLVCAAALEHLRPGGIVAFISSDSADEVRWGLGAYASSKAALDATIRVWRLEHPEVRFQRIVMGPTFPTDFTRSFDSTLLGRALTAWTAQGIRGEVMLTDDVGRQLVDLLSTSLNNPGIDLTDVRLQPVGAVQGSNS